MQIQYACRMYDDDKQGTLKIHNEQRGEGAKRQKHLHTYFIQM